MPSQAFVSDLLGRRAGNILCNTHTQHSHTHTRARELPRVDKRHWERTPCTISRVLVNGGTFISRHLPLLSALTCKSRAWPGQPRDSSSHCARSLPPSASFFLSCPMTSAVTTWSPPTAVLPTKHPPHSHHLRRLTTAPLRILDPRYTPPTPAFY